MVRVDKKDWLVKLDDALWAYRTSYKTPITGKLKLSELEEIWDEAYECASAYKEKLKRVHDAKIRKRTFEVGKKLWLYNSRLKLFLGKLKSKWMGPYVITRVGRFVDVEIEDMQKQVKQVVNGHHLKPYLEDKDINMLEDDKVSFFLSSPDVSIL
ncbi:uncharacterized protein LOC143624543 [Bidens hawaiensis]|uniref:uncharacterized protein LOC143624543 n=1 Tax=Bidens hawaiensis TaxID=980011 RepID=UPI004049966E